jgi:hypothetical protein
MPLLRSLRRLCTDADLVAVAVPAGRVAIAATMFAAPTLTVRSLGTDTATARRVTFLTRMMAVRDGALGAGGVLAARRGQVGPWLLAAAACDATDAVVVTAAIRAGRLRGPGAAALVPFAAVTAVIQAVAAVRLHHR